MNHKKTEKISKFFVMFGKKNIAEVKEVFEKKLSNLLYTKSQQQVKLRQFNFSEQMKSNLLVKFLFCAIHILKKLLFTDI